jgi:hypothetical protein
MDDGAADGRADERPRHDVRRKVLAPLDSQVGGDRGGSVGRHLHPDRVVRGRNHGSHGEAVGGVARGEGAPVERLERVRAPLLRRPLASDDRGDGRSLRSCPRGTRVPSRARARSRSATRLPAKELRGPPWPPRTSATRDHASGSATSGRDPYREAPTWGTKEDGAATSHRAEAPRPPTRPSPARAPRTPEPPLPPAGTTDPRAARPRAKQQCRPRRPGAARALGLAQGMYISSPLRPHDSCRAGHAASRPGWVPASVAPGSGITRCRR